MGQSNDFSILVNEYKNMVYSLCLKMTNSTEDAEEIAQDAFIKAYKGLNSFKGNSKFSTWLYQITYFTAASYLRKHKIKTVSEYPIDEINHNESNSSIDQLQQKERQEFIDQAMLHLNHEERAVITLFYLDEFSIKEIAAITKLKESNVKVKIHRTKKKLYGILNLLLKNELNSLV